MMVGYNNCIAPPDIFHGDIFFYSLARFALLEAFNIIGIKPGDAILLPEFICRELIAAIYLSGAKALFYSIDEDLKPKNLPRDNRIKAVIAVNYFGFPQDLSCFTEFCNVQGAALIEDNAHGFLSRDVNGELLGSRGDMGILSFRKTFPLPDGCALVVNKSSLGVPKPIFLTSRKDPLPKAFLIKSAFRQIQNTTQIPLKKAAEAAVRVVRKIQTGNEFPKSSRDSEKVIPGQIAIHAESLRQLGNHNLKRETERRRHLYLTVEDRLKGLNIQPIFSELPEHTVPYGYPFRADRDSAKAVEEVARKMGFDCPSWPELPDEVAASAPPYYKNVYWINFLC